MTQLDVAKALQKGAEDALEGEMRKVPETLEAVKKADDVIARQQAKKKEADATNPSHYKDVGIDALTVMALNNQDYDFCLGNVLKYAMRAQHKNGTEDLRKARWYLTYMIGRSYGMSVEDAIANCRLPYPGDK